MVICSKFAGKMCVDEVITLLQCKQTVDGKHDYITQGTVALIILLRYTTTITVVLCKKNSFNCSILPEYTRSKDDPSLGMCLLRKPLNFPLRKLGKIMHTSLPFTSIHQYCSWTQQRAHACNDLLYSFYPSLWWWIHTSIHTHIKAMTKIGFVTDHYLLQVIGSQSKLYHQIDKGGGTCKTPLSPPSHSRVCFHDGSNHDITRTITPPLMSVNMELQTCVPRADASPPRGSRHSELLPYTKYTDMHLAIVLISYCINFAFIKYNTF